MLMMTPPLAVPSSLVKNDAVDVSGFLKDPCLLQTVLPRGRVQHQQSFVRRVRLLAGDHPANFL